MECGTDVFVCLKCKTINLLKTSVSHDAILHLNLTAWTLPCDQSEHTEIDWVWILVLPSNGSTHCHSAEMKHLCCSPDHKHIQITCGNKECLSDIAHWIVVWKKVAMLLLFDNSWSIRPVSVCARFIKYSFSDDGAITFLCERAAYFCRIFLGKQVFQYAWSYI